MLTAAFHVPVIGGIFNELVGNTGGTEFWQIGLIILKTGVSGRGATSVTESVWIVYGITQP